MQKYFKELNEKFEEAHSIANTARKKGNDPSEDVEILPADDLADRVENLVEIEGVSERISELEKKKISREKACLKIAEDILEDKIGNLEGPAEKAEAAVRTAVALLTEGVVAAPIEGISEVTVDDLKSYLRISYSGPIRSAGGTAQVISVLVADYMRRKLSIEAFKPTSDEIERYVEEIPLYKKIANLQYTPSEDEIKEIVSNCSVMIDGEATEDERVSGQRSLERVKTDRVRGGMCLVVAEGIALKARKLEKLVNELGLDGWDWLGTLIEEDEDEEEEKIKPNYKYLSDLIAGRPVFSHPSKEGGFRLRYGRARNSGLATAGINPATMYVMDSFLSAGTQIKMERPGKAAGIVPVTSIDGPTVRLSDGSVVKIDSVEKAKELHGKIEFIIDVGEMLVNFGDFIENNHPLVPPSYTEEWWSLEVKEEIDPSSISSAEEAVEASKKHGIPLHPKYTFLWHDLSVREIENLRSWVLSEGVFNSNLHLPFDEDMKRLLEKLLVSHKIENDKILIEYEDAFTILESLGLNTDLNESRIENKLEISTEDPIEYLQSVSDLVIKERSPTRIGCRMGRPEKSKERKMRPPTHVLFPVGEEGGKQRSVEKASDSGRISVPLGTRKCRQCGQVTFKNKCQECEGETEKVKICPNCGLGGEKRCPKCGKSPATTKEFEIKIDREYKRALREVGERNNYDRLKGVKGLTSKDKVPEPLEKGILRAKHDLYVFKDGTIRYDLTDLPITHVKPREINTSIEEMRSLGYTVDIHGNELTSKNQIVELKVQDVVLSKESCKYFLRTSKFVDDLLENYYGLDRYYEASNIDDLKGELMIGLAPHTSAGVVSRLIGYTDSSANLAHPYFHAAKRRNCFHPSTSIVVYKQGERNLVSIKNLVEELLDPDKCNTDRFGTLYQKPEVELLVPSIDLKGSLSLKEIEVISRHKPSEHLVKITTSSECDIKVTPDHNMLRKDSSSGLEKVEAHRISKGDEIPAPDQIQDLERLSEVESIKEKDNNISFKVVEETDILKSAIDNTYSLTVKDNNTLLANGLYTGQCDGDEDCYMLLMDGLINFSRSYLPDKTGGRMDAPLVVTSNLDPKEVDDEAHNIDIVWQYPTELYEAASKYKHPEEVEIEQGKDRLGKDIESEISGFGYTHETEDLDAGPKECAYKTLGPMIEKMESQLALAKKTRAVDSSDVAEKVIESHFLPDLLGNMRAFSTQKVRCVKCNTKYRRIPLQGICTRCGGDLTLTVHENSVKKYLEVSKEIAEEYDASTYIKERLNILDISIKSLFENDLFQQKGLSDFM